MRFGSCTRDGRRMRISGGETHDTCGSAEIASISIFDESAPDCNCATKSAADVAPTPGLTPPGSPLCWLIDPGGCAPVLGGWGGVGWVPLDG